MLVFGSAIANDILRSGGFLRFVLTELISATCELGPGSLVGLRGDKLPVPVEYFQLCLGDLVGPHLFC